MGNTVIFDSKANDLVKGVVWASSICDVNEDKTIVVSVINLTEEDASFRQDMEIGEWEEAEILPVEEPEDPKLIVDGSINWDEIQINPSLADKDKKQVKKLVEQYKDTFQWSEYDIGKTNLAEH